MSFIFFNSASSFSCVILFSAFHLLPTATFNNRFLARFSFKANFVNAKANASGLAITAHNAI
jgi:hypothetical protein